MRVMKELQALSVAGLENRLKEFKKELLRLKVEVGAGTGSASSGKVRRTRKNIARVLTRLKQKEVQNE